MSSENNNSNHLFTHSSSLPRIKGTLFGKEDNENEGQSPKPSFIQSSPSSLYLISQFNPCIPHYLLPTLLTFSSVRTPMSLMELMLFLAGLECLFDPAGEEWNERRFFTEPAVPFSGVPFVSDPRGLDSRDLAFADAVGVM